MSLKSVFQLDLLFSALFSLSLSSLESSDHSRKVPNCWQLTSFYCSSSSFANSELEVELMDFDLEFQESWMHLGLVFPIKIELTSNTLSLAVDGPT